MRSLYGPETCPAGKLVQRANQCIWELPPFLLHHNTQTRHRFRAAASTCTVKTLEEIWDTWGRGGRCSRELSGTISGRNPRWNTEGSNSAFRPLKLLCLRSFVKLHVIEPEASLNRQPISPSNHLHVSPTAQIAKHFRSSHESTNLSSSIGRRSDVDIYLRFSIA